MGPLRPHSSSVSSKTRPGGTVLSAGSKEPANGHRRGPVGLDKRCQTLPKIQFQATIHFDVSVLQEKNPFHSRGSKGGWVEGVF